MRASRFDVAYGENCGIGIGDAKKYKHGAAEAPAVADVRGREVTIREAVFPGLRPGLSAEPAAALRVRRWSFAA
jgi:hypothetical protein